MRIFILMAMAFLLCGCGSKDVIKKGEGTYQNKEGEVTTAKVTYKNKKLNDVSIDETKGSTTKRKLGKDYHMKEASVIGKEWDEQINYLQTYIKDHGIEKIQLDEQGKAKNEDVRSGCTISIDGYIKAVKQAMEHVKEVTK